MFKMKKKETTGMETVLGAQVDVLKKAFGASDREEIDEAVLKVEDYSLDGMLDIPKTELRDIVYAAGYIRGCAEMQDMTIGEMLETYLP